LAIPPKLEKPLPSASNPAPKKTGISDELPTLSKNISPKLLLPTPKSAAITASPVVS
jgi:hypothetical protein